MMHDLAFVVSHAYEECNYVVFYWSRHVHEQCMQRPFEYSGLTPCILWPISTCHRISAFRTLPPGVMFQTLLLSSRTLEGLGTRLRRYRGPYEILQHGHWTTWGSSPKHIILFATAHALWSGARNHWHISVSLIFLPEGALCSNMTLRLVHYGIILYST